MKVPDGTTSIFDLNPGQVLWLENVEHSWELLSGQVHLFAVEVKAARGGAPAATAPSEREAVVVDPTHHNVILENDHVRIFEALAAAGDTSPMHTHPPTAILSLGAAPMRMTLPDGSTSIFDLHPAQALWIEDVEHSWEVLRGSCMASAWRSRQLAGRPPPDRLASLRDHRARGGRALRNRRSSQHDWPKRKPERHPGGVRDRAAVPWSIRSAIPALCS